MVSKESKQDLLVTLIIIAIIGTIAGAILYAQSIDKQVPNPPPPVVVEPNPDENNNQTNPDNNNNQTNPDNGDNVTDPDNNNSTNPDVDYFEYVCNIKPMAEVCIKPNNSTNSTTN